MALVAFYVGLMIGGLVGVVTMSILAIGKAKE